MSPQRRSILPAEKTDPAGDVRPSALIYGASKIGKSTFCSRTKDVIFLATEPGLSALAVHQIPITSWEQFLETCAELAKGEHHFQTIVIDTVDNLHKLASDYVRRMLSIPHESDAPYGKGFGLVNDELHRALHKLAFLPYQLILVSHSEDRDVETRTGKVTRTVPSLPEKTRRIVLALVDLILYVDMEPGDPPRRVIRTKPNPRYEAGDRTGLLPETLDFDYDALQAALRGQEDSK
jgi:AAA domain